MKYSLSILISVVLSICFVVYFDNYDSPIARWISHLSFGSINFPTSLDSLTNPASTDSVATVSHSAQHANANDAITALETKMGIGASTAVANSIFVGTGSGLSGGISRWTTYATATSMSTTLSSTTNLTAFGSSTLQNFTALQATTTQATTTNLAITSLVSQIPYANATGGIIPLTVGSGLTLTGGTIAAAGSGSTVYSTTSDQAIATTTITGITSTNRLDLFFHASSTKPALSNPCMTFNGDSSTSYYYENVITSQNSTGGISTTGKHICFAGSGVFATGTTTASVTIYNVSGTYKWGRYTFINGDLNNAGSIYSGQFTWTNTSPITSITIDSGSNTSLFATATIMQVIGI